MTRPGSTMPSFDLYGPLPEGTVVLEASAGTGKTYAIAALATRYLAEGVPIDELMMITFGRAATVELRERVRERLVSAATALADPALADSDGAGASGDDALVRHLAGADPEEVARRRDRLVRAVADFDAATIATTHGFCQQMLAGLGIAADVDHDARFAEDTTDVVTEVVQDLFVRAYGRNDSGDPPFGLAKADSIARAAVVDGSARLEPQDATGDSGPDLRRRIGEGARTGVERRKRARRLMDYDDLLVHLRDALADSATGTHAQERIRSRYSVVLVDEFQDTDPVQWEILRSTFHGHRTLVLIGDPKQAIYAFRGADVTTYLLATAEAQTTATLGTNWRSDAALVQALQHVTGPVALGDARIAVHEVGAAYQTRSLSGGSATPVRLRVVTRDDLPVGHNDLITVGNARPYVAADVASDIVRLLESGARVTDRDGTAHPVGPADVAVLVQRNADAGTVREALRAVGVPAVLTGTSSVFLSDAATDWRILLTALEQPHRPGLARAAALTSFLGWRPEQLATEDESALDGLSGTLREWAETLSRSGVAALLETVTATSGLLARVLARENGERELTDLRHIGQVLHAQVTRGEAGSGSLAQWLQQRITEAQRDTTEEMSRRLESDATAVQIVTVHRSKGLEFPIVYAPYLWDRYVNSTPDPLRLHDADGERVLDVGGEAGPGYAERKAVHAAEDAGESLRLAYVALTRARSQVVVHWAPTSNTAPAPLQRLLFGARQNDGGLPLAVPVGADDAVRDRLHRLAAESAGTIAVEHADGGVGRSWRTEAAPVPALAVREFDRELDLGWARTSYSGLTAGVHELLHGGGVGSEAEQPGTVDEPSIDEPSIDEPSIDEPSIDEPSIDESSIDGVERTGEPADGEPSVVSPMAALPTGAAFGTLVHGLLEEVDFTDPGLRDRLLEQAVAADSDRWVGVPAGALADAVVPSLSTPLGPLASGRRLVDVPPGDRLDELAFELPLVGGDTPTGEAHVEQVADLLREHLPPADPLAGYADDLAVPLLASRQMRGFLTGSIDLVVRVRDGDAEPRYVVVDYKTNWLGTGEALTAWHYRLDALVAAMREAHYPLQALLYSVALHRFLRWRQRGYDPAVHLGGVLYLFLRGMCGPDTPTADDVPYGVFSWRPPTALVVALSDLLDRGTS